MEKEQVTGKVDEMKGKAKQAAAGVTGNPNLHDEGVVDEGKGKVKQAYGDLKDTIKGADRKVGTDIDDK
ncbi:MAG: CsbD family protein [Acidobacteriaceae bacterium]|nr:CsbD family protein [Acidobacteriaceae bacterium]